MVLHPVSFYAHELKPSLPKDAFAPSRWALVWLPIHYAVIVFATLAAARGWLPWWVTPALSLAIGWSFASLTFVAHEALHGAVVRGMRLRMVVGWLGFLPFVLSPRLWIAWHNRVHHGHTQQPGVDPDAYPTLDEYRNSRRVRIITDYFALGRGRWMGAACTFIGFSVQSAHMLVSARKRGYLSPREHWFAIGETALGILLWAGVAAGVGIVPLLFAFVLPLLIANGVVMAFILTNHGLSPLSDVNDPLVNSLSVTTPRWLEFLTLRFGMHVEHHLFPAMSSRHALRVRELVRARWPERYQTMPLARALRDLYRSPRVYKDYDTLIDPHSGREWPTLQPRAAVALSPPQPGSVMGNLCSEVC